MSPRTFLVCLTGALLFIVSPGVLRAQSTGLTNVTISIPGISIPSKSTLVATPTLRIVVLEQNGEFGSPTYSPGPDKIDGHVVIERNWSSSATDWADWFEDAYDGQEARKDVTLTYSLSTLNTVIIWRDCVPARYEIVPGTSSTAPRERLTLLPASMDTN